MIVKILSILLIVLHTFNYAISQSARLFTLSDDIPSSQFISISEDKDGYIWTCNFGGLARFDGLGWTSFRESRGTNSLRNNRVYELLVDTLGQRWVCTARGLQIFHPKTNSFEHVRIFDNEDDNITLEGISVNISDMYILPCENKMLVCAGIYGFFVIDIHSKKVLPEETKKFKECFGDLVIQLVFVDSKQRLWVKANKLMLFDLNTLTEIPINYNTKKDIGINNTEIIDFLEERQTHTIFFADTWHGVLWFDEQSKQLSPLNTDSNKYQNTQCLLQRKNGTLLVGYENNGIGQINIEKMTVTEYTIRNSPIALTHSKIHAMHEDRWENLFVGIYQKGMLIVPANLSGFNYYGISDSSSTQNRAAISSFLKTKKNQLLVGTDGGGIFQGKSFECMRPLPFEAINNGSVQNMVTDNDDKIWVAIYGSGLFCYDNGLVTQIAETKDVINKNVRCLQFDSISNRLFVGNIGTGLNQIDLNTSKQSNISSISKWVLSLKLDSKRRLWVGTSNCCCYDPTNNRFYEFNLDAINNCAVYSFFEYNNLMFVGTGNGLFIYNEKTDSCRHYPLNDTDKTVIVRAIAKGTNKFIWMSTNIGLIRFDPENESYRTFFTYEIRSIGEFRSNSVYTQNDGTIIFGGDNGIITFNPIPIEKTKVNLAPIHFCSLIINGNNVSYNTQNNDNILDAAINYASKITLPHDKNSFAIQFSPINYAVSQQLNYQYQLNGYEKIWHTTPANNPVAIYNQLPAGNYKLQVKSFPENDPTNTSSTTINVTIRAPWYWCWWSKLMYFLILSAVAYSQFHAYKMRQISKKRTREVMGEFLKIKETYQILTSKSQQTNNIQKSESTDDKFKKKIMDIITNHISDSLFGVEKLSAELDLNRVHLYRRVKELFDCSPTDLIKSVRMKKAGLMLIQNKDMLISDIAFKVGFSEPSYFSKSFKNYYNMSPKNFIARYRDNADDETLKSLFEW